MFKFFFKYLKGQFKAFLKHLTPKLGIQVRFSFLLLRFLEKESAQRAAARNPKGDKSGRGRRGGQHGP